MASPATRRQVYDNFTRGDYGSKGAEKAPANSFRATNMLVYADGSIGPRPGWRNRTPSGMPTGKINAITPTTTPTADMLFIVGNKVYTYDLSNLAGGVDEIGTLAVTPTLALYPKQGTTEFYITVPSDKCYKLDPVSGTIDPYDTSPGGYELELYGERLVVVDDTDRNMIKFSEAADFDDWPAENFITILTEWAITSLREQKNHLAILTSRTAHVLTGVPGTDSATQRRVERGQGPLHPGLAVPDDSDMIWFVPAFRTNPATFDGAGVVQVAHLTELSNNRDGDLPSLPVVRGVAETVGDQSPSTLVIAQGDGQNKMLINHNGIWTRHTTSINISGMVRGGYTRDVYITDGGNTGVAGKIYSNDFGLNRPANTGDTLTQPGDDTNTPVSASVSFPEYQSPDGSEVAVVQVIVDFRKWNIGTSTNNFVVTPTATQREYGDAGELAYTSQTWNEAITGAGASAGDNQDDRAVFNFQPIKGGGFSIAFSDVRGVAIQKVTVVYETYPEQPRA